MLWFLKIRPSQVLLGSSYHARDERQGTGVISHWDKFVTPGEIPGEAYVSFSVTSNIYEVIGRAHTVDRWL